MARNNDGYGIRTVGQSDGPGRVGTANTLRQLTITYRFAVRDLLQATPHKQLKLRAAKDERQIEFFELPCEIRFELANRFLEWLLILNPMARRRHGPSAVYEIDHVQTAFVARQKQRPNRTLHGGILQRPRVRCFHIPIPYAPSVLPCCRPWSR